MGKRHETIVWTLAAYAVAILATAAIAEDDAVYELREINVFGESGEV